MVEARYRGWGTVVVRRLGSTFVVDVVRNDGRPVGQQQAMALDLADEVASNSEGGGERGQ